MPNMLTPKPPTFDSTGQLLSQTTSMDVGSLATSAVSSVSGN
jgi:hypothetical protein